MSFEEFQDGHLGRWPPWQPSWISELNNINNSKSGCSSDASHQVSTQSDLHFGRQCGLKNFMAAILDIGTERF